MSHSPADLACHLLHELQSYGGVIVAFSGGVDSAVVAAGAVRALGPEYCLAVTGVSPSLPRRERIRAGKLAAQIGIPHRELDTAELNREGYRLNRGDRCYFCKSELYSQIRAQTALTWPIANGTNRDDLGDFRPGLTAADEHRVLSPLVVCQIDKAQVRQLAGFWQLPVATKPASPCLASRVAVGVNVTAALLEKIDRAEDLVLNSGFSDCRVRVLPDDVASVEVPAGEVMRVWETAKGRDLCEQIRQLGFRSVSIHPEGLQSGRFNSLVPLELKRHYSRPFET